MDGIEEEKRDGYKCPVCESEVVMSYWCEHCQLDFMIPPIVFDIERVVEKKEE